MIGSDVTSTTCPVTVMFCANILQQQNMIRIKLISLILFIICKFKYDLKFILVYSSILKIFDIQFNGVRKLLDKQGIGITITDDARKMLAHKGFTPKYGARQVAGVIRNYLRRPISRLIINEELGKGKSLEVGLDEQNELTWNIHQ
jgi:hypothetical protein